jgi:hypothetical protein
MDINFKNTWIDDDNENIEVIKEDEFNDLMGVPKDPIKSFNIDEFFENMDNPKKQVKKLKTNSKRVFDFKDNKPTLNMYYILPIIGVITLFVLNK